MEREKAIRIFKCLSDASRLNIIATLQKGEAYGELDRKILRMMLKAEKTDG